MPFTYDPYRSPYAESIAESIAAPGRVQAQGVLAAGQAQAQGQQQSGAIWGNAVANAGQGIAGAIALANDPARKIEQAKLQDLKRQQADLDALDKAYSQPGGREAIINALPGHLKGTVLKQFEEQDKLHAEAQRAQEQADQLSTEAFADLAVQIRAHGYDPSAAQLGISDLKMKYAGDPRRLAQLRDAEQQIRANPTPETVKSVADPLIQASTKRVELDQKAQDTAADNARQAATAAEIARHNAALETTAKATEGRQAGQLAETIRHNTAMERAGGKTDAIWVTRDGEPIYVSKADVRQGDVPYAPPRSTSETAQDRLRIARVTAAKGFLDKLNELREKINTKMGPAAGATGLVRRGVAAIGWDPDVAEYERERAAGGRSLAVAIMGAQNLSDQDAKAWADMLPSATVDKETAKRLMDQVGKMITGLEDVSPQKGGGAAVSQPPIAGVWVRDKDGKLVKQ